MILYTDVTTSHVNYIFKCLWMHPATRASANDTQPASSLLHPSRKALPHHNNTSSTTAITRGKSPAVSPQLRHVLNKDMRSAQNLYLEADLHEARQKSASTKRRMLHNTIMPRSYAQAKQKVTITL